MTIYLNKETFLCIELTDVCNLSCIMCDQTLCNSPHPEKKGFMNQEFFKSIFDCLKNEKVKIMGFAPHWLGESLLHPKYIELLEYAAKINKQFKIFDFISTNTNATELSFEHTKKILLLSKTLKESKSSFKQIFFSVDAFKKQTYIDIKGADKLEIVKRNIDFFITEMIRQNLSEPLPIIKFIVMKENFNEVKQFFNEWSNIFKKKKIEFQTNYDFDPPFEKPVLFIDKCTGYDEAQSEKLHRSAVKELGLIKSNSHLDNRIINNDQYVEKKAVSNTRRPCPALWKTPMISNDGTLIPCCNDNNFNLKLGNLNEKSFTDMWCKGFINELRISHIRGDFSMNPCNTCPNQRHPLISDKEIEEYLTAIGKPHLILKYYKQQI